MHDVRTWHLSQTSVVGGGDVSPIVSAVRQTRERERAERMKDAVVPMSKALLEEVRMRKPRKTATARSRFMQAHAFENHPVRLGVRVTAPAANAVADAAAATQAAVASVAVADDALRVLFRAGETVCVVPDEGEDDDVWLVMVAADVRAGDHVARVRWLERVCFGDDDDDGGDDDTFSFAFEQNVKQVVPVSEMVCAVPFVVGAPDEHGVVLTVDRDTWSPLPDAVRSYVRESRRGVSARGATDEGGGASDESSDDDEADRQRVAARREELRAPASSKRFRLQAGSYLAALGGSGCK